MSPHGHWGPPMDDRPPVVPQDAGFRERMRLLWDDTQAPPARHRRPRAQGPRARGAGPALSHEDDPHGHLAHDRRRRVARARAAGGEGDRPGHRPGRRRRARHGRGALRAQRPDRLGHLVRADLAHRLGRPARARRPAPADLRPSPADADRLLRAAAGGRPDQPHDERRRGARLARHRHGRDAVPGQPHADRLDRDPAAARLAAGAARLPDLPGHGARVADLPDRQRRRLPPHARDDRLDHRGPAGDAVRHPRRALLRARAVPP